MPATTFVRKSGTSVGRWPFVYDCLIGDDAEHFMIGSPESLTSLDLLDALELPRDTPIIIAPTSTLH